MGRTPERVAALALFAGLLAGACRRAEPPEAAQARLQKAVYEKQIAGLEQLIVEAEKGQLFRREQLAVGIEESVVRELVNATLPLEVEIGGELRVRVEKAEAYFRFTQAGVLLESRVSSVRFPGSFVAVQLLGTLDDVKLEQGRFSARIDLVNAQIQGLSLGTLAKDVLDGLLKQHLKDIEAAIPPFEVPVRLEQSIKVGGLGEGPVSVAPGSLPLEMSVARVVPGNKRLWVLLDVKVAQWVRQAAEVSGQAPPAPRPEARATGTKAAPAKGSPSEVKP